MELQSLNVVSMSLVQLFSLISHKVYDGDEECFQCEQDIINFVRSFPEMAHRTDIDLEVVKKFLQNEFPESYPFDGNNYIPCVLTYRQMKEEEGVVLEVKDLPLLGVDCKVCESLARIIYEEQEQEFFGYEDGHATYAHTSRTVRITFQEYEELLRKEQLRINEALAIYSRGS